eukprot:gene14913-15051_t
MSESDLWLTRKLNLPTTTDWKGNPMNSRLFIAGAVAAFATSAFASGASAESFTFTYTNEAASMVSAASPSGPLYAGSWKGVLTTVMKSGAALKSNFQCTIWPTPGQGTNQSMICDAADTSGDKYSVTSNCLSSEKGPSLCWGYLQGLSGKYAGKVGVMSQIGGGASGAGQGAWAD